MTHALQRFLLTSHDAITSTRHVLPTNPNRTPSKYIKSQNTSDNQQLSPVIPEKMESVP